MEAWEAVAGQVYGPSVEAAELEMANITPEDSWQQVQDSSGLAAGLEQHVLDATQLAHTKGGSTCCLRLHRWMLSSNVDTWWKSRLAWEEAWRYVKTPLA